MESLKLIFSTRRYFATAWVFASLNVMIGTWVLYIPYIKDKLDINDGQLGIALFFLSLGTLIMIPVAPRLINKFGSGKVTIYGILTFSVLFQVPLLMDTYTMLCFALFMVGMSASLTDISMNALVSDVEQEDNVHYMSASHGFFSLGGVIGAGIGSLLITLIVFPYVHMMLAMGFVVFTNVLLAGSYYRVKSKQTVDKQKKISRSVAGSLIGLAVIAFIVMGSEGAIEHWSKLYMQDIVLITSDQISGFGFVAFSMTMTVGRFFGDSISKRYGAYSIIIGGCIIATIGFAVLLTSTIVLSILGFSLIGLGYSVVIPELFRLAGKRKDVSTATGISFVAGFGYVGFLASPAIMGLLSELDSLKLSFTTLMISTILIIIIAGYLKAQKQNKVQ